MSAIYKILCEVRCLHEYYLTGEEGENIFENANQDDRSNFLFTRFVKDLPGIHEDIEFSVSPLDKTLNNQLIKLLPSYSGFKLAIRCRKEKLMSGDVVYKPYLPLPDDVCFRILINEKRNISRFTNDITTRPYKARWYFSNQNHPSPRLFPFLTAPIANFVGGQSYIQGELASHAGIAKAFLNNGAPDPWLPLPGTRYANSNDALVLPLTFVYRFDAAENILSASFSLKDNTNALLHKIDFNSDQPLQSVQLNFHTDDERVNTIFNSAITAENMHSLEVTGSNGYAKTFSNLVFVDNRMQLEKYAGIIDLVVKPADAAFHLLDGSGLLHARILSGGTREPHPIFEIWMKSKLAFWQYRNNRQRKIALTPETQDLLADNSGILQSKNPIPMTYTPLKLKKPDNSFKLLPNPPIEDEVMRNGNTLILPIQVSKSNLFPTVP